MTLIKFHVEGGVNKNQDGEMREGFRKFFAGLDEAVRARGNSVRFVLHGSRRKAYEQFCAALQDEPGAYHVLLVDSEDPVAHRGECWRHLQERQADGWERPAGVEEAQCQLMAEAVEAWFFADREAVEAFYGPGFQTSSLPSRQNIEQIPKSEHIASLEAATKQTKKEQYHKKKHPPALLSRMSAEKVRARAWHCDRIFVTLSAKFGEAMAPLCTLRAEP